MTQDRGGLADAQRGSLALAPPDMHRSRAAHATKAR